MKEEVYVPEPSPTQEHQSIAQPQALHPATANLRDHQQQLDADGCIVGVSRQALEETLAGIEAAAPFLRLADEVVNAPPESDSYREWLAESRDWMVIFSFGGKGITLGDLRKAAAWFAPPDANASERVTADPELGTGRLGHK